MAIRIRNFMEGDEAALRDVFYSSIHQVARRDYTPEQIDAWAPAQFDRQAWAARMRGIQPFIAEVDGRVAGYADLQPDGYIDHFYVGGEAGGQGVGSALMRHIHEAAAARGIAELSAKVSLSAQPFFEHYGFTVIERRMPVVRGVSLANACMRKSLGTHGGLGDGHASCGINSFD